MRPWLQSLEQVPHLYLRETLIVRDEIRSAVDAFNGATAYRNPIVYVKRWDETMVPSPEERNSPIEELVNVRLDDIIYWIYARRPEVFGTLDRTLGILRRQFEEDRRALKAGEAPADKHFMRAIKKHSATHHIGLPAGREDEFAEMGLRKSRKVSWSPTGARGPSSANGECERYSDAADFSDIAHVYAIPHVESATLDRRMRHYVRTGSQRLLSRGGLVNYSERVYESLAMFIDRNS